MSRSTTFTLDADQTGLWESDTPEGERFRRDMRRAPSMGHVEIVSHDGVVLDSWDGRHGI